MSATAASRNHLSAASTIGATAGGGAAAIAAGSVQAFHLLLTHIPPDSLETVLAGCCIPPSLETTEQILRTASPHSASKFFRWAAQSTKPTPSSWNLFVEILGKTAQFEPMWDAIKTMHSEKSLTFSTFATVISIYCSTGLVKEATMTYDVMDRYGFPQDVVAVNCVLSSICGCSGRTADAAEFFDRVKGKVKPDRDSFAILLQGWEREGNVARAKTTFGEMVVRIGWNSENTVAYDAFLNTLLRGLEIDEAVKFLKLMGKNKCLPGPKFFTDALDMMVKRGNHVSALALWNIMVEDGGVLPAKNMFTAMISLLSKNLDFKSAFELLDEMPYFGMFPDFGVYNDIFESLVRNKRAREVESFFAEMRKNELMPSPSSCAAAIKMFFEQYNPDAAFYVWNGILEERVEMLDGSAKELLLGLLELDRMGEIRRLAKDFHDKGIKLRPWTMAKLKITFCDSGKHDTYDRIEQLLKQE